MGEDAYTVMSPAGTVAAQMLRDEDSAAVGIEMINDKIMGVRSPFSSYQDLAEGHKRQASPCND